MSWPISPDGGTVDDEDNDTDGKWTSFMPYRVSSAEKLCLTVFN